MKELQALTCAQQALVEHYLSVVDWVITDYIKINPQVCGLGYSDVHQEGCFHLCRAASSYAGPPEQFGAYARKVVWNGLISYCRKICQHEAPLPLCLEVLESEPQLEQTDSALEQAVLRKLASEDLFCTLDKIHTESSGVVRLGIEALILKAKGMSGQEIAALYGVKPNHVGAWISRAAKRLRGNADFQRACSRPADSPAPR